MRRPRGRLLVRCERGWSIAAVVRQQGLAVASTFRYYALHDSDAAEDEDSQHRHFPGAGAPLVAPVPLT